MKALHRKLWRELWHMRGQVLAIALVLVGGVGVCVMSLSTYHSLQQTRDQYYIEQRFAQVFVDLKRAPLSLNERVKRFPGVAQSDTRVIAPITLEVSGFEDTIQGLMHSIPDDISRARSMLNGLYIRHGRWPDRRKDNEVLISDAFAEQHELKPYDTIQAIINGRQRTLMVVGVVLSPEHVIQIAPGALFPDFKRYAVMWMPYTPLSKAYDMDASFNNLVLTLQKGVNEDEVMDELDRLLDAYGGQGAYGRDDQLSSRFLQEEFKQLDTMAFLFPVIFLGVALFLLNVVIGRLVQTQREIIAALKAFGYSDRVIFFHYAAMVIVINIIGIVGGLALGIWLGRGMTALYVEYYRFPGFRFQIPHLTLCMVAVSTLVIALLASARSVYKAAALAPAEAMRPEAPARFRHSFFGGLPLERCLAPTTKMIIRQWQRRPARTLLSVLGLALATAIMMVGHFQRDAIEYMIHAEFVMQQKHDIEVVFSEPVGPSALYSLSRIPGVNLVEGKRSVAVTLRNGHQSYRTSIEGLADERYLQSLLDTELQEMALPHDGVLLSEALADKLGLAVGDRVLVETLEGAKASFYLPVSALSRQFLGVGTYMRASQLNRYMREGPVVSSAQMSVDLHRLQEVLKALRQMPRIIGINLRETAIRTSYETLDRVVLWFTFINALLGAVIAFGVVYNTVRIALAERGRELASLRVLGYGRFQVAYVLLGELAMLTLISFPLGFTVGYGLCLFMANNLASDLFRIPLVLTPYTYAFSALIVILAALVSGLLVWRRVKTLNLVEVLKTRE